jgi:hypothetical protein
VPDTDSRIGETSSVMSEAGVACGACCELLDERPDLPVGERLRCPRCGATSRRFGIHLEGTVELKSQLGLKARSPGEKKPFLEQRTGDDLFRKARRWMVLNRIIDRRRNRYFERLEDPETGAVLRHADEKLTDHRGRGSARQKHD